MRSTITRLLLLSALTSMVSFAENAPDTLKDAPAHTLTDDARPTSFDSAPEELAVKTEFLADAINAMAPIISGKSTVVGASNKDNVLSIQVELNAPNMEHMTEADQEAIVPVFQKAFAYKTCNDPEQKQFVEGGGILNYDMVETTSGMRIDTTIDSCPSADTSADTPVPTDE